MIKSPKLSRSHWLLRRIAKDEEFVASEIFDGLSKGDVSGGEVRVTASEIESVFVRTESLVGVEDQLRQCCF